MKKSQSLLTALFFLFLQTSNAQTIQGIKFENYAIKVSKAKKAKIDYASHSKGKLFKTAITEGYRDSAVNFGGHYVCTFWGSGQGLTGGVMVDILTGKIYSLPLTEDNSYRQTYHNDNKNIFYHANSNLFVCNRNEPNAKNDDLVNLYYYFYEWDDKAKKFSLVTKKNVIEPFSNTPVSYNTLPHALSILVKNNGDIMLSGKKVSIDNLKRDVQNALVKKAIVPDEIPIKYESEVLTDIRGEVETEVNSAIAGAKWLKKNKSTVAAKSVTTKSVATKSTATTPSVMVDKKGDVTLSGKKIPFDDIKKELQKALMAQTNIPNTIPVTFDNHLLMGIRGEVNTEVSAAIKTAKWLKKKAALDALRQPIERDLKTAIQWQVEQYKTADNFAFVVVKPRQINGKPMDYAQTPFKKQFEAGSFTDKVFGLLKYENGAWKVLTYSFEATDVPSVCWWKEYNAPKTLFNKGMISTNCK